MTRYVTQTVLALLLAGPLLAASGLSDRIRTEAAGDRALAGTSVTIETEGGAVVLGGTVRLYSQKLRWEQVAWRTAGVEDVDNEIRVLPVMPIGDDGLRRAIATLIHDTPRFHGARLSVDVARGVVRLSGTFHDAADVLLLKHRVAEIEGITGITIDARFRA